MGCRRHACRSAGAGGRATDQSRPVKPARTSLAAAVAFRHASNPELGVADAARPFPDLSGTRTAARVGSACRGRELARDWGVGPSAFLETGRELRAEFKLQRDASRVGDAARPDRVSRPEARVAAPTPRSGKRVSQGVTVDRYGVCLDWSMAVARDRGERRPGAPA